MNIAAITYYHGGMLVEFTRNIDRMTHTAHEITEAQRDSYEALTENLAAFQRRSVGFAQEGLRFIKLQEENARAAQQWVATSVRLAQLQQRNLSFVQDWLREGTEAVREQTEHNVRTAEAFARGARKQQEGYRALVQSWTEAYEDFFFSPFNYAQQGVRVLKDATEQELRVTQEVGRQGLRVAEEATREAELRASVLTALQTDNYEGLTVAEVTEKLDDLSVEELKELHELEKRNKNRESLIERIDSKIRANS